MVHLNFRGVGIGKAMCAHSIEMAKEFGYKAMQFDFVISTNLNAIGLWKSFSFEIIGTIPIAFDHQKAGLVDVHIMYKPL